MTCDSDTTIWVVVKPSEGDGDITYLFTDYEDARRYHDFIKPHCYYSPDIYSDEPMGKVETDALIAEKAEEAELYGDGSEEDAA